MPNKCDFCGNPAKWDGQVAGMSSWAYACESCKSRLNSNMRRRLPLQGSKNKGKTFSDVHAYMEELEDAVAECPCGRKQPVEPDAESAYCMDCGAKLTFTSPIEQLFAEE